jgi:hypothetical protein
MQTLQVQVAEALSGKPLSPTALFDAVKDFRSHGAIEYYSRSYGLPKQVAEEHFLELMKFLSIAAFNRGDVITPSDQLDEMWHAMIIQTREYDALCERLGIRIHHATTGSPRREAYLNAINLYRAEFGEPHPVWTTRKLKHDDTPLHTNDEECVECGIYGWCSCFS